MEVFNVLSNHAVTCFIHGQHQTYWRLSRGIFGLLLFLMLLGHLMTHEQLKFGLKQEERMERNLQSSFFEWDDIYTTIYAVAVFALAALTAAACALHVHYLSREEETKTLENETRNWTWQWKSVFQCWLWRRKSTQKRNLSCLTRHFCHFQIKIAVELWKLFYFVRFSYCLRRKFSPRKLILKNIFSSFVFVETKPNAIALIRILPRLISDKTVSAYARLWIHERSWSS